tara:strand:- start:914 stop:1174 length:261 start_codon:yes stop_codon:yes gene_type:complete
MTAFFVATAKIKDAEKFQEYAKKQGRHLPHMAVNLFYEGRQAQYSLGRLIMNPSGLSSLQMMRRYQPGSILMPIRRLYLCVLKLRI